ncbi:2-hydroxyacid dehydrogenase [Nocardia uniformis]|uniref:2-hydroxyacid dehydrogenase n=1 Tax=Nocardia uniformis TaxID=53432 RepID=A0A849C7T9_9NOCA|nr:2-hydroxyacid dehydrogenase [Nocardia uniformis]NNH73808.1 2-hydroxyacid dehydrogenase [Nocardia uniformis]
MHVLVPHADAAQHMGGVPEGVELIFWPGTEELPAGFERAEVFVPPWWAKQRAAREMARMPKLQLVQTLGAGYDWIIGGLPPGVLLANASGVNARPVAEWVLGGILNTVRGFPGFYRDQLEARWDQRMAGELGGSRAVVLGYGQVGQRVAALLRAFDVDVAVVASASRPGVFGPADVVDLLRAADIVVVAVPLNTETTAMVDERFLARMRDGSILVNVARGAVVDTDALVAELKVDRIRAVLDVTDPEPLPTDHELWRMPGVIITPHVASVVPSFLPSSYRRIRAQLVRMLNGDEPENVVAR